MAKFLNTSATNYYLEELIKSASDRLILISPFLKINDRIKALLEDKNRLKIDVRIVYGKSELQPEEINWLKQLTFVRASFCKNLNAKGYINEKACIVTSLNLYEFGQVNNNEMGIYISKDDDALMYKETYEEGQRIISISDETRITLKKVAPETENNSSTENMKAKLSSSKLARKLGLKTPEFLSKLADLGLLEAADDTYSLTTHGNDIGGEAKRSKRFGDYFIWPRDLNIES
ncbi:MAG: phospholipase D family protein [Pseudomonadales bacterium]|nr:phospholipase D family protein [Pseudomonadales bacterium]